MKQPRATKERIRRLAELAGLELTEERLDALLPQIEPLLEARRLLEGLDLDDTPPELVFIPGGK